LKVLVTGATGFIGRQLCRTLEACGYEVIPIVRTGAVGGEIAVGNIGPATQWQSALATQPDIVVHLAARSHAHAIRESTSDTLDIFGKINCTGSLNLARQAAAAGVKRFVFLSSIKVNGEISLFDQPFRPDDIPAPGDAYAISKAAAENGLRELVREIGLEVVIIRPPVVYGVGVKGNFASMVRWLRKGLPLPFGAVHNRRSLVGLDNLVDFIALCADRERSPRAANEVFLISDGEDLSTTELLRKVARAYGVKPRLVPVPARWIRFATGLWGKEAMADRLLGSLVVDGSKTRDLLGWRPLVSMDRQLQKMARHDALL
jgi:nucleoside-diphosphate-sugar epimerase